MTLTVDVDTACIELLLSIETDDDGVAITTDEVDVTMVTLGVDRLTFIELTCEFGTMVVFVTLKLALVATDVESEGLTVNPGKEVMLEDKLDGTYSVTTLEGATLV